jgi:hypothetical protein
MVQKWKTLGLSTAAATVAGLLMAFAPAAANASTIAPAAHTLTIVHTAAHASPEQTGLAGYLVLCSEGGYASYISFPNRGGLFSEGVPNGYCAFFPWAGNNEQVNVYDYDNKQYIGSTIYNGSVGETIVTIAGPSFYAYNG